MHPPWRCAFVVNARCRCGCRGSHHTFDLDSSRLYAGGSYSFPTVGSTLADRDALPAPANDRLMFAGEATMRDRASTVAGALMSGLREASRFGIARNVSSLL